MIGAHTNPFDCFISEVHRKACRVNCERPTGSEIQPVLELAIDPASFPMRPYPKQWGGKTTLTWRLWAGLGCCFDAVAGPSENCLRSLGCLHIVLPATAPYIAFTMTTFAVSGMTCNKCVARVETALKALSPSATVTLNPPRAVIDGQTPLAALNAALAGVGKYALAPERNDPLAWARPYFPLFLIVGLIALAGLAGRNWMLSFMGGWFIVFGAFKLLDVPAFAAAYRRYDIVAKALPAWGYAYPFVEVALGFAFLFWWQIIPAAWVTLLLSLIGAVGVIQAVLGKQTIQCACLGTVFKLPMSTITIIENLGMAAMAAWMLAAG